MYTEEGDTMLYFILGMIFAILGVTILSSLAELVSNATNLLIAKMAAQLPNQNVEQENTRVIGFSYDSEEEDYDE